MRIGRFVAPLAAALAVCCVSPATPAAPSAACNTFMFTKNTYPVDEAAGSVTITVRRANVASPSSIEFLTSAVTAKPASDFQPASGTLHYTTGAEQSFVVQIVDDASPEPSESFLVELRNPAGCRSVI